MNGTLRSSMQRLTFSQLGLSPDAWSKPDKEGELKKQGHVVKNWKTRWFVIQNDHLFYFKAKGVRAQGLSNYFN